MCGICGALTFDGARDERVIGAVRAMTATMVRRGPDANGCWTDPAGVLALGFRRLAILDLTVAGNQPMVAHDGRSAIVFNGEIYNFQELKAQLESRGVRFRTRTDTEVLLEALNAWGLDALPRLNGMFALAWYDIPGRRLLLARDHAGIKPLYYHVQPGGKGVAFASQYSTLLANPWGHPGRVRGDALRLFLRLHHLPPPFTLLENTHQLEPGHWLSVTAAGRVERGAWWSLPAHSEPDLKGRAALEATASALDAAVRRQRVADVPVGVFLSGGVDSPLVTAVASAQAGPGLHAYTVGSPGWRQDESEDARRYAEALRVDFHLSRSHEADLVSAADEAIAAQHEPFGDFSIIPTLMVSRAARQTLTVALSGDGGDELFFGYERPRSLLRDGAAFRWPWPMRVGAYAAGRYGLARPRSEAIIARTPGDYYFGVNCRLSDEHLRRLAPGLPPLPEAFTLYRSNGYKGLHGLADYSRRVEYYGQLQRGLKKVDMASMHHSLEVRVPLLDRDVLDVSLRIDPFENLRDGRRKAVLHDLLARHVPAQSIPAVKRGFAVPLGEWLRGPLRDWAESWLLGDHLYPAGTFDPAAVRTYWHDHVTGRADHKWGLWTLIALQGWGRTHAAAAPHAA